MMSLKTYATEYCGKRYSEWANDKMNGVPNYDLKVVKKREINQMSHESIRKMTKQSLEVLANEIKQKNESPRRISFAKKTFNEA